MFVAGILLFLLGITIYEVKVLNVTYLYNLVYNFWKAPVNQVASNNNRTNILVMGVGGKGHEGSDLTDTMMIVSISLSKPEITIVSLPRDLWVPEIRAKINSAYHYGGAALAKISTERVTGVPIQYTALLDFSSFKNIVDALGGIQVNVERSFTDKLYPIEGRENDTCGGSDPTFACRYETVSFNQGPQYMDGETALKFVRSRHAEGDEGTDQAREARQQKVIDAIKNKILSPSTFLNINKDVELLRVAKSSIETDIDGPTAAILARKAFDGRYSVSKYLIPGELLINPPISKTYDQQYVLIPQLGNGKWSDVNTWFASLLK